jgi:pilus assembly protein CpaE
MSMRSLLVVLSDNSRTSWAQEFLAQIPDVSPLVLTGTPLEAATYLAQNQITPSHIVLDIGMRGQDVLGEVDQLAQQCEAGTRVLAVGDTNDILLYRGLVSRGVIDYLPMPATTADMLRMLTAAPTASPVAMSAAPAPAKPSTGKKRVIAFMSAASGDGASTAALNIAFAMSQTGGGRTVLVDMDYQFGMVAKHLNLQNQYGIGDLFDHPDRGLDATLIKRMVASYGKLDVITAPADLRFMPSVSAEAIRALVDTLTLDYDQVILDLPHVWVPWMGSVVAKATDIVLVAQLWLKSVSHASRMTRVFRDLAIPNERIHMVINRSGARFKEGIEPRDFGRVCGAPIAYTLTNDIKTIVNAEAAARTIIEMGPSELADDIATMARGLLGQAAQPMGAPAARGGLFSRLKG